MEQPCRTKYPILLVHGVFYRKDYWGRIPEALRPYMGGQEKLTPPEK